MIEIEGVTPAQFEALTMASEECAEVVQCVSKINRFGMRASPYTGVHNREKLERELGDVLAQLAILGCNDVVTVRRVMGYAVSEPDRHVLHWLYVKRDFRGVGIGAKLLAEILGTTDKRAWTYTHKMPACDKFLRGMKHAPQHARVKA